MTLPIILFVFLIKGIFLILLIPPWEAPEELGHVSYVQYLVTNRAFPSSSPFMLESINKSLVKERRIMQKIQLGEVGQIERQALYNRENKKYNAGSVNVALNPPLYYLYLIPFYTVSLLFSSYGTLIFLRFGSLLLGLGTVIMTYVFVVKLTKNKQASLIAALLVSMHPMFSFMSSVVNNDAMVIFLFALFIAVSTVFQAKKKNSLREMLILSCISGLGALTKPQLFVFMPLFILFLYLKKLKVSKVIFLTLIAFVLPFFWYLHVYVREGSLTLSYPFLNPLSRPTSIWLYPVDFILSGQPKGIFMTFWGFFGWLMVALPMWAYAGFAAIVILSIIGWAKGWKKVKKRIMPVHIFLASSFFLYVAGIIVFDIWTYRATNNFVIQGRYFLPAMPILMVFLVGGLNYYARMWRNKLIVAVVIFFIISQIITITHVTTYYYGAVIPPIFLFQIYNR